MAKTKCIWWGATKMIRFQEQAWNIHSNLSTIRRRKDMLAMQLFKGSSRKRCKLLPNLLNYLQQITLWTTICIRHQIIHKCTGIQQRSRSNKEGRHLTTNSFRKISIIRASVLQLGQMSSSSSSNSKHLRDTGELVLTTICLKSCRPLLEESRSIRSWAKHLNSNT